MVRIADYDTRRKDILRAAIELYFNSAHPVSSGGLLAEYRFDLSPATIRNVFKDLEELGYLIHPHTSAGRVPTDLGYRFYIDDLMNQVDLTDDERKIIQRFFTYHHERKSDVFEGASRILSNFTHYAGMANHLESNTIYYCGLSYLLEQPEFKDIDSIRSLFRVLEEDRLLDLMKRETEDSIQVFIGEECDCPAMKECSVILCECRDPEGASAKLALLGPRRMAYQRVLPMMQYVAALINED